MWSALGTPAALPPRHPATVESDDFFDQLLAAGAISSNEDSSSDQPPASEPDNIAEANDNTSDVGNDDDDDWEVDGWDAAKPVVVPPAAPALAVPEAAAAAAAAAARTLHVAPPPRPPPTALDSSRARRQRALEATVLEELQHYLLDFADPRATEELNGDLNDPKGFARHVAYYAARPELASYTIEQEVCGFAPHLGVVPQRALKLRVCCPWAILLVVVLLFPTTPRCLGWSTALQTPAA
jgi:hypothetical protein